MDFEVVDTLELLGNARIVELRYVPWGSNDSFLVFLDHGSMNYLQGIYKPCSGEVPLHDFPNGSLFKREYAAYLLSQILGWPLIPPTVIRDGPYGVGIVQLYIESDPNLTYFDFVGDMKNQLLKFAVFDFVVNNADRKGGHFLLDSKGIVWSIDHGLTFHHIFKMRTVMTEFWGTELPVALQRDLNGLIGVLNEKSHIVTNLSELISEQETNALFCRIDVLLRSGSLPELDVFTNVPWSLL